MHLPDDCSSSDRQREEEFNQLVRNMVPNVFHYTEKMLRSKRSAYARQPGRYKAIPLYKKLMSGTAPLKRYWIHSLIINLALANGWKITRIHNTLTFTVQALTQDYIQYNQDMRLKWIKLEFDFLANFPKLMNNAFDGWFCRPVETYKNTTLLFSGEKSYAHFENFNNDSLASAESLQEQALIVVNNRHDNQLDKKEKIESLYDCVRDKAKKLISRHRNYIINTRDELLHSSHKEKITLRRLHFWSKYWKNRIRSHVPVVFKVKGKRRKQQKVRV